MVIMSFKDFLLNESVDKKTKLVDLLKKSELFADLVTLMDVDLQKSLNDYDEDEVDEKEDAKRLKKLLNSNGITINDFENVFVKSAETTARNIEKSKDLDLSIDDYIEIFS